MKFQPLFARPAEKAAKPLFQDMPRPVLQQIGRICGAAVIRGEVVYGGVSAAAGFRLFLDDGRVIFAKGSHPLETTHATQGLRQEIEVYRAFLTGSALAPDFIGTASDGNEDGWSLGLWAWVDADPAFFDLQKLFSFLQRLQSREGGGALTPAPDKNFISQFFSPEKKWKVVRGAGEARIRFLSLFEKPAEGADWLEKNGPVLERLQEKLPDLLNAPLVPAHGDLRPDNLLCTPRGFLAVDWPNACLAPAVFDPVFLFSALEGLGCGTTENLMRSYEKSTGSGQAGEEFCLMLCAFAGYFAAQAGREVPPRLPALRWMQKCMLVPLMCTMSRLGIIESPPRLLGQS